MMRAQASLLSFVLVAVGIAAVAACGATKSTSSSNDGTDAGPGSGGNGLDGSAIDAGTWAPVSAPAVGELYDIWGSSANDAWIAADSGLLHWDGTAWTKSTSGGASALFGSIFSQVTGTAANDVWLIGSTPGPQTFAVAFSHFDGTNWSAPTDGGIGNGEIFGAFATSAKDVWAVGKNESNPVSGTVLHYDGASWKDVHDDASTDLFAGVWASNANDVWVAGHAGIVHFDGTNWINAGLPNGAPQSYGRIFGTAHDDVWAIGQDVNLYNSTVLHFDGTTWSIALSGTKAQSFGGIFSLAGSDVTLVGTLTLDASTTTGLLEVGAGGAWNTATLPSGTASLYGAWGTTSGGTWIIGDRVILHRQ